MKVLVSYMATIPNEDIINAGISLFDDEAIAEFFHEQGGEEAYHDHGVEFEIINREINL